MVGGSLGLGSDGSCGWEGLVWDSIKKGGLRWTLVCEGNRSERVDSKVVEGGGGGEGASE